MKKVMCVILSVILAVMCCAALADEYPEPDGGKKFSTNWAIFGMTVEIDYEEEGYRVYIKSSDPDGQEGTEWEISCLYSEEKDELISVSSSRNPWNIDPATGDFIRGDYEYQDFDDVDQVSTFKIDEEGFLIWQDGRDNAGADLAFTDIGDFAGVWRSEDGKTWAEIEWNDSEENYGYFVFVHDGDDDVYTEHTMNGLYNPETCRLEVTGTVSTLRMSADGSYEPEYSDDPVELVFSDLGCGKILLEKGDGVELIYDIMGGFSQG